MTVDELRQAAIECLGKAFKGRESSRIPAHVIQAALSIVLTPPAGDSTAAPENGGR